MLVQQARPYDISDICDIRRHAYEKLFTVANVTAGLEAAGFWPANPGKTTALSKT